MPAIAPIRKFGWCIVPVHYSHDPQKNEEWADRERPTYTSPIMWNRMQEIDFSVRGGIAAHPAFRNAIHVRPALYSPSTPLCLLCDFNVGIMAWPVAQIVAGEPVIIGEVSKSPASVPEMVREFRNRWPAHEADVHVYGDATGQAKSAHDKQSAYDLILAHFRGYPGEIILKVPTVNPAQRERLDVLDFMLKDPDGRAMLTVDPSAVELLLDFKIVVRDKRSGGYLKSTKSDDEYSLRGHALEALGYFLCREWPMATLKRQFDQRSATPRFQKRLPPRPQEVWVPGSW